jgi:hypothetical protein
VEHEQHVAAGEVDPATGSIIEKDAGHAEENGVLVGNEAEQEEG